MIWPLIWLCGTVEGHFRLWQFYKTLSLLWVLSVALKYDETHEVYCRLTCTYTEAVNTLGPSSQRQKDEAIGSCCSTYITLDDLSAVVQ